LGSWAVELCLGSSHSSAGVCQLVSMSKDAQGMQQGGEMANAVSLRQSWGSTLRRQPDLR